MRTLKNELARRGSVFRRRQTAATKTGLRTRGQGVGEAGRGGGRVRGCRTSYDIPERTLRRGAFGAMVLEPVKMEMGFLVRRLTRDLSHDARAGEAP